MMTAQEMFDKVAVHLLTQKTKSLNENGFCRYRGLNNTKCAAGCLLSDKDYHPNFEGGTINSLVVRPAFVKVVGEDNIILLRRLQQIHDDVIPGLWSMKLHQLAVVHKLNTDCLKQFAEAN